MELQLWPRATTVSLTEADPTLRMDSDAVLGSQALQRFCESTVGLFYLPGTD